MGIADTFRSNDRLRQERIGHNWRQQDLADQLGTTVVTIRRWERGSQQPSAYFRVKLCALFGKSAEELGLGVGNAQPSPPSERDVLEENSMDSSSADSFTTWTVPYRRNPYFTGRDDLLSLLNLHLEVADQGELLTLHRATLTQPQAMKGLGGIGKTQIAVEYAYRAREQGRYTHTLWINAASRDTLISSFTALATVLPAFPEKNETNQPKLVAAIKCWLEQCQQRWFLIFDNADDLSLIQEYVPNQGNGSILLTTRATAVGSLAASIDVEKMGFMEGTHLLLRRAQREMQASDEEVNEAGNIVVALDHFPLALEQAGAYIEETGCSFGNYLELYQTHRSALLARRGAQSTNYPDSVATTWSLSFQKIEQVNPAAAELLQLCAFLAPDHIPEELLTDGAQYWSPVLQQAVADPFAFNQMLEALLAFSLVKRLTENHQLSIHRLVQAVQQDRMGLENQRQWAERVIAAVNAIFPRDPKNEIATWPQCLQYLEQAQACDTLIQQWTLTLTQGAELLDRTGTYLREHASYTIAEPLYQHALHIWEQNLKPEHPQLAPPLNNLASLYCQQGKYAEAEPLYQRALHIQEQSLGSEPPQLASSLNGLANLYYMQGKYAEAEPLYQRALRIWEQSLGSEHPQLGYPLNGLASLYKGQGKYAESGSLLQRALRIREQSLGPEHPDVAYLLNNLAELYRVQGKYAEAEPLYQRTLHIWEQSLGPEHPLMAYPFNNLAELYQEQGKYAEAEPLYQRALHIWEQSLGPEHPQVAYPLAGLAILYRKQGRYTEAESLFQHALSIHERVLESDHPDIAETLHNFAVLREAQGKREQAISLYGRALQIRERVYGPEHSKTAKTRECLHAVLGALSQTQKMVVLNTSQPEHDA
jgi:tetratricopeptide (TPR) repeat protein/transcriptional regulator with XRE-family HTH domain